MCQYKQISELVFSLRTTSGQHRWQSQFQGVGGVHVPGHRMCWMEVHSGVGAARGDTIVTGAQCADSREHSVSLDGRRLPHRSSSSAATFNHSNYFSQLIFLSNLTFLDGINFLSFAPIIPY